MGLPPFRFGPAVGRPAAAAPRRRRAGRTVGLAAGLLLLSGCQLPSFGFQQPVGPQSQNVYNLWSGSTIAALVVGVFVWGLIGWSVVRYRKNSDELPRQVRYNIPIEVLYTAVPVVIIAVLFYFTAVSEVYVNRTSKNPDVTIGVRGFRWQWQFDYVKAGPATNFRVTGAAGQFPVLVVPTDRTLRFEESSNDVIHSFYVPQLLFKRDVVPGRLNVFELTIAKPGRYIGRCAEFCGVDHDRMDFYVEAMPPDQFDQWASAHSGSTSSTTGSTSGSPS